MTASAPSATASRARSTVPTCTQTRVPARRSASTHVRGGRFQWKTTTARRSAAATSTCSSTVAGPNPVSSTMKPAPNGDDVMARVARIRSANTGGGAGATPISPRPPALDTAAARGGMETNPIGASTMGTRSPYSSVSRVRSTGASARRLPPRRAEDKAPRAHQTYASQDR